jgi:hypothetical protein
MHPEARSRAEGYPAGIFRPIQAHARTRESWRDFNAQSSTYYLLNKTPLLFSRRSLFVLGFPPSIWFSHFS